MNSHIETPETGPGDKPYAERQQTIRSTITDLITNGNLEFSLGRPQHIQEAADVLPHSIGIYVPSLPGRSNADLLLQLTELKQAGFDPIPHLAARRVTSRQQLHDFLKEACESLGVHRIMLIGGDSAAVNGPYNDAFELLEDGVLSGYGISEVGLAGYPEGHPRINESTLSDALVQKLALATQQGMAAEIVTQFCFNPGRIIEYSTRVAELAPTTPVYVGMAGPTDTKTLLRYAKHCGVSTSLRGLVSMGVSAAKLFSNADPSKQLIKIAGYCANHETNIIGVHMFSFGGFLKSAKWMHEQTRRPGES
jgi:methylenetetrahydrofolate reductase (NADPH)